MIDADALAGLPDNIKRAVVRELTAGYERELVNAQVLQKKIDVGNQERHKSVEGVGRLRMRVDATLYHKWGQEYGYDCWRDGQFLREIERDNPGTKVNCGGTRIQVGYNGR